MFELGVIRWTGAGILVVPLMLVGVAFGTVVQNLFDGTPAVTDTAWVAGFLLSAVLIRVIGSRLNAYGNRHTLYDSPMQSFWWLGLACALITLGIVILVRFVAIDPVR